MHLDVPPVPLHDALETLLICYAKHGGRLKNISKWMALLPTYEISVAHEELNNMQLRRWMYVAYHVITLSESEEYQLNL